MTEIKKEQQPHSFKRKLGNTTYTVKVHFSKDTDKTFKDMNDLHFFDEFDIIFSNAALHWVKDHNRLF